MGRRRRRDCAPSADSLRLLSLPDILRWYIDRIFGHGGALSRERRRRGVERAFRGAPSGATTSLASVSELADELDQCCRAMLATATTSPRSL